MSSLERLKSALEQFARGSVSAEQSETVRAAIASGQVTLVTGERAIAVGGDANGAVLVSGDNNVLLTVSASTAEAVKQAIASLVRPSPNQLPADLPDFQGRQEHIERLRALLSTGGTAAVTAIGGMGGVGKSALALHVAHQLADAAPDGRIFVDLGGTSPQPLTPLAALIKVIQALQPEAKVPTELGRAQVLYRSCLDGERVLLLLDNAANSAQVAPLVDWRAPTTLVIVTSRQDITAPGLKNIRLDIMEPGEARDLLRVTLSGRSATEDELNALSERCGRLPLALRVAGTFLALARDWTVDEYLQALADERQRLRLLKIEDDTRLDVQAVLGFSARKLAEDNSMLAVRWQMLAAFPQSFDRAGAAAVWEAPEANTRRGLGELVRRSMVLYDEADGRYRLHDLMRDVARLPIAGQDEAAVQRRLEEAAARHAQHYCRVLAAADEAYMKDGENSVSGLVLYDLEQGNIAAGQAWAGERIEVSDDSARLAARYTDVGVDVLYLRLTPRARIGWHEEQLKACQRLGDRRGEGAGLGDRGNAYTALGEPQRAIKDLEQYLAIAREIGDRRGEGRALGNLGAAYAALGDLRRASEHHKQHLAIAREIGDRRSEGIALGNLGIAFAAQGETRRAIEHYEQALQISREIGDRWVEAQVLLNLGIAYKITGDLRRAIEHYEQALQTAREIGDRGAEGKTLGKLGNAYRDLGEPWRAIEHHEQALQTAREIGDREGEGCALGNLGNAYCRLDEPQRALDQFERVLTILREIGDRRGEATTLCNSALALDQLGERGQAITRMKQALPILEQIEDPNAEKARAKLAEWRGEGGG